MSESVVPGRLNAESHVHHIFSTIFLSLQQLKDVFSQKSPTTSLFYLEMTLMFVDKSFPVSAKISLFQFKGKLKHFPLPKATHSSLDSVSSPVRRLFSRAHKIFKEYFCLCLPHKVTFQTFLSRGSGTNPPGSDRFSCTCTKSLPRAEGQPVLLMCSQGCTRWSAIFSTMSSWNLPWSIE